MICHRWWERQDNGTELTPGYLCISPPQEEILQLLEPEHSQGWWIDNAFIQTGEIQRLRHFLMIPDSIGGGRLWWSAFHNRGLRRLFGLHLGAADTQWFLGPVALCSGKQHILVGWGIVEQIHSALDRETRERKGPKVPQTPLRPRPHWPRDLPLGSTS